MLYRVESVREADKGKNKGKKTGQNEITPGGGMTGICGFMRSSFRRGCSLCLHDMVDQRTQWKGYREGGVNSIVLSVQICYTKSYRLNK